MHRQSSARALRHRRIVSRCITRFAQECANFFLRGRHARRRSRPGGAGKRRPSPARGVGFVAPRWAAEGGERGGFRLASAATRGRLARWRHCGSAARRQRCELADDGADRDRERRRWSMRWPVSDARQIGARIHADSRSGSHADQDPRRYVENNAGRTWRPALAMRQCEFSDRRLRATRRNRRAPAAR